MSVGDSVLVVGLPRNDLISAHYVLRFPNEQFCRGLSIAYTIDSLVSWSMHLDRMAIAPSSVRDYRMHDGVLWMLIRVVMGL